MIVLDIETTGLYPEKHGICEIGAINLSNPKNFFLGECRIDDSDEIDAQALAVNGKNLEQLKDKNKISQKELIEKFFLWLGSAKIKNFICENPHFDIGFIQYKARKYGLKYPFKSRAFDLHSISAVKYFQLKKEFLIKNEGSDMGLTNSLNFVGLEDKRGFHSALEDAKLEAECFYRIVYGKNFLKEFAGFPVPDYLKG